LTLPQGQPASEIWLLEEAPIQTIEAATGEGQLQPELSQAWKEASAVRQLNWLWQQALLWQPLSSEGVASSLLEPGLVRVEGSVLRLLELRLDPQATPTLAQLGEQWSQLAAGAAPTLARFLEQLCAQLINGEIQTAEQLVALLDRGLDDCGRSQKRTYQIFTRTDSGPSRDHNEDACYPASGELVTPAPGERALAIVCDGIGGHEGGEVASELAIATLRKQVETLATTSECGNPTALTLELEGAVCEANDAISQQNDSEQRSERRRMGTTLVMAKTCAHEIYITHVGDSRVYQITRQGCHQVTQDDDLASREVRLGYALYRGAVQQPTSGSLVQALGMAPSTTLHPTVQRFVLDEDCVFLLCSDGLSDFDRVEQYWQSEILPVLDGHLDLATAGQRLIEIANIQNGHDNVTVALVRCQVTPSRQTEVTELSPPQLSSLPVSSPGLPHPTQTEPVPSGMKTQQLSSAKSSSRPWALVLGILLLLGLGGVLAYLLSPELSRRIDLLLGLSPSPSPELSPVSPSPTSSPAPSPSILAALEVPTLVQVTQSTTLNLAGREIPLLLQRGLPERDPSVVGQIPAGSILQVRDKEQSSQQQSWVQLRVCTPGTENVEAPSSIRTPAEQPQAQTTAVKKYRPVESGDVGWLKEAEILQVIDPNFPPDSTPPPAACAPPVPATASPSPTPTPTPTPTRSPS
jgi:serine/threonine protein phosphatase PrpC